MFVEDPYEGWRGMQMRDEHGCVVGSVSEVLLDADTGEAEWLALDVTSSSASSLEQIHTARLVPVSGAQVVDEALVVRWTRDQIDGSPEVVGGIEGVSRADEDVIYSYYGLDYPKQWVNSGVPGGGDMTGVAGIAADGGGAARGLEAEPGGDRLLG